MDKEKVKKLLYRVFIGKQCNCKGSCKSKDSENKEINNKV
jgi:hypothetical protein